VRGLVRVLATWLVQAREAVAGAGSIVFSRPGRFRLMRIALVSPYSWTFPGGVTRHVEELGEELIAQGHHVRILSPVDPDDRLTRVLHRRGPERVATPDHLIPLGRTAAWPANGSTSNLSFWPEAVVRLRRELRAGRFDVVHVHEPIAPMVSWDACSFGDAPVVGTFHTYSSNWFTNAIGTSMGARRIFNKLHARIAVSEAARWTGERYYGGRYEVIPNGVDASAAPRGPKQADDAFRILFVGRDDERKGLPVLLSAFGGLREHVPVKLQLVGASTEEVEPFVAELNGGTEDVEFLGSVGKEELWQLLHSADVLCAPSLGGESFGMVLIEAFAAGTPVVASDIAGYRQVVTHGRDGLLVPPAHPLELAKALRSLWLEPDRRGQMGVAARARAADFAWPRVAAQVTDVYQRALEAPWARHAYERATVRLGLRPADLSPRQPARRLESLEPVPARSALARAGSVARRLGVPASAAAGVALGALAMRHVDLDRVFNMLVRSSPAWVLVALALFSASMFLRAASWHAIVKAALPRHRVKRRVILSGTLIGVLMSATLPARLGEPSRALIVARRLGRMRETLPVLVGTLVSQTLLNLLALALLGAVVASTSHLFSGHESALVLVGGIPAALVVAVLLAPAALGPDGRRLSRGRTIGRVAAAAARALLHMRRGLEVFRRPRLAAWAISSQLAAWALQLVGAYALLAALNLDGRVGLGAAAAVLFAVNVTAVVPVTPSNVGVFQFAVVTVLAGVYGVPTTAALGYGIILQAVELTTAVVFGLPALIGEGLSWRDVRMRALAATPVELSPRDSALPDVMSGRRY
jgi:phosphatidylinositol alpha-mannosyltransferase